MNNGKPKRYQSPLRASQAEETGRRILDAAVRVLERGLGALSVPAVAREAGVAVPTVYRHFPDKVALIRAVSNHLDSAIGALPEEFGTPDSPAALAEHIRYVGPKLDGRNALMGQTLAGPEGAILRREWLAARSEMVRGALVDSAAHLSPEDFERLVAVTTVLCTSQTLGVLTEHLGFTPPEAAEVIAWAILRLSREEHDEQH